MDNQTWLLLALGLLIAAAAVVSAAGWTLFARERRLARRQEAGAEPEDASGGRPSEEASADA